MDLDVDLQLEMKISCRELRVLLLHEFRLCRKATEATRNIFSTMGKDALSIRTAQNRFHRFKNGNFELDDLPHIGRLSEVDISVGIGSVRFFNSLFRFGSVRKVN